MNSNEDQFGLGELDEGMPNDFGAPVGHAGRGTVHVGKTEYAVDLSWHIAAESGKAAKEARSFALMQPDRPEFYCVRKGTKTQYALGSSAAGHRTNMPSLAAHVAQSRGASFVGLFKVTKGYYLLGVQQSAILADADRFFENPSEATAALDELLGLYEWPEVIAPAEFGIEHAKDIAIEDTLKSKITVRLGDLKRSSAWTKYAFAAAIAGIVVIGGKWYYSSYEDAQLADTLAQMSNDAQNKIGLKKEVPKAPDMPWVKKVMGGRAVEACFAEIQKFPLDIPGWTVTDLDCKPIDNGVNVAAFLTRKESLENGGSPISYAEKMVKVPGIDPRLQLPGSTGTTNQIAFAWQATGVTNNPVDIKTETIGTVTGSVLRIMEDRRTTVSFSPADTTDWWIGLNIEFKTSLSPLTFTDIMAALPGYLLDDMKYDIDKNEYTIKGKVYEQKPTPVGNANAPAQ